MRKIKCILCPNGCELIIEKIHEEYTVKGNSCDKGLEFALEEIKNPKRVICSTVRTSFKTMPRLPVKTDGKIPMKDIDKVMNEINKIVVEKAVDLGDIVLENVLDSGVDIVATSTIIVDDENHIYID
ncbi:DUF1667 domain-containing protein [Clostridium sediminicola]|uniref:DUF1667 domain-containing protein n=1 Tax=Clostridium sediminicola TaxID=3114879 RepID=UPI0031F1CBF4